MGREHIQCKYIAHTTVKAMEGLLDPKTRKRATWISEETRRLTKLHSETPVTSTELRRELLRAYLTQLRTFRRKGRILGFTEP